MASSKDFAASSKFAFFYINERRGIETIASDDNMKPIAVIPQNLSTLGLSDYQGNKGTQKSEQGGD